MKTLLAMLISGLLVVGCDKSSDQSQAPPSPAAPAPQTDVAAAPATRPDNTGVNVRDRDSAAVTAGMQSQGKSDVEMAADLRRRIMAGKMSINAENVKVTVQGGKVTLRGPVNTQDEKDKIAKMAADVAGAANVDNQLEVKAN